MSPDSQSPRRRIDPLDGRIGFENDEPGAPSPDLPVSAVLADMIEALVRETGLAININSSCGGRHSPRSFHYAGQAVDINRIGGRRVDDPANEVAVHRFQAAALAHPDIAECFGPCISQRAIGHAIVIRPDLRGRHLDHVHLSSRA